MVVQMDDNEYQLRTVVVDAQTLAYIADHDYQLK